MIKQSISENLGEPDLKIAGFQLWIHGLMNLEDGRGWVSATAHCGASGSSVWTDTPNVLVGSIKSFGEGCDQIWRGEIEAASLGSLEPDFFLKIEVADTLGHLNLEIEISPDYVTQSHSFKFEIDQSYLPVIIKLCAAICEKYPVRIPRPRSEK